MKTANTLRKGLLAASFILLSCGASGSRAQQSDTPQADTNAQRLAEGRERGDRAAQLWPHTISPPTDLEKNAASPTWVGYAVNAVAGQHSICCGNYNDGENCRKCALETGDARNAVNAKNEASKSPVLLEGGRRLIVLFRLQDKQVMRVKAATEDCVLDAGGLGFVWLTAVKPAESVAFLGEYVRDENLEEHGRHSIGNEALAANRVARWNGGRSGA